MRRSLWVGAAVAVGAASVWYLQAPPRTADDYRHRAQVTVEALRSQIQTARVWVDAVEDDRATHQAAVVAFREVEEDARKSATKFAAYEPPAGTTALRTEVVDLAAAVVDALARLRISASRGEWGRLADPTAPLPRLSERLDRLAKRAAR